MKFSCMQENFSAGLQMVSHAAGKNISLPILNNVLLKAENKELKLITTNLEMAITCRVRAKVEVDGEYTFPARLLADYLAVSPLGRVDLELKEGGAVVQTSSDKTTIKGVSAGEFPLVPHLDKNKVYGLDAVDFKQMLQQTLFAASRNESRPELGGVFFNFNPDYKKGHLVLATTDSYRLAEKEVKLADGGAEKQYSADPAKIIVPARALIEISRIISSYKEDLDNKPMVEMAVSDNQVMFSYGSVELISRLIEGQYPDYRQIIPTSFKTTVGFASSEWLKRVKAASLFANIGVNGIMLEFKGGSEQKTIISSTNGQLGNYSGEELCQINGEDNKILLNYRYFLDGLVNLGAEEAELKIISPESPCLLSSKSSGGYLYIIMPIKQ